MPSNPEHELDFKHPDYKKRNSQWTRCRDVLAGEDAVKDAGEAYLPRLKKQSEEDYKAYLTRGEFYEASKRTLEGFVGAIMRKDPSMEGVSDSVKRNVFPRIGSGGEDFEGTIRAILSEHLTTRWGGVFVDSAEGSNAPPYISVYYAEDVWNWRREEINGVDELTLVVLAEEVDKPEGPFVSKRVKIRRVLQLIGPGNLIPAMEETGETNTTGRWRYFVTIYEFREDETAASAEKGKWVKVSVVEPSRWGGKGFERIPFRMNGGRAVPIEPPMLGIVNMNLSHYRTSVDLEHGRHLTALPTPVITGFDDSKMSEFYIGSAKAWVTDNDKAKAFFLEFSGNGLAALEKAQESKERRMAVLGGRLLEDQKNAPEAAATVRLRQAGESSVLADVAREVSSAVTWALNTLLEWRNERTTTQIELNRDFNILGLTAQDLSSMMALTQAQLMSWDTFFWNMKRGEIVPDGRTSQEELELIAAGGPMSLPGQPIGDEEDEDEEEDVEDEDDEEDES